MTPDAGEPVQGVESLAEWLWEEFPTPVFKAYDWPGLVQRAPRVADQYRRKARVALGRAAASSGGTGQSS